MGRQPWIVYEVMRTEEAVTGADGIPVGYATLVVVYLGLAVDRRRDAEAARAQADGGLSACSPDLAALLVAVGLTAYVVLGGADFGTGIWDLTARDEAMRARIKRSMSPVWEANHVWLIFILVIMWTAFPEAFGSIMSTLTVPMFLAAVGIILRGSAFALRGEAATMFERRAPRRRVRAVLAARAVLSRGGGGRHRLRTGARGQRRG